ncbi:MAG TPA: PilN domain-containing protein [Solirubrobacterales bacterium]|jgi:Tfp pilus assembly protein PilN|nr:PilN domain-containing protein [Solirubrobacterales bacterium]
MRPVNLIPPEERQGSRSPLRTGPLPYIVLGALAALLIGVALLVTTGNQITEEKDEIASLKQQDVAAQQRVQELAPYVQFAETHRARLETVSSLADSRFDWERVMGELSKILPADVWLTNLNASASSATAAASAAGDSGGSSGSGLRGGIAGPALEIGGCTTGQDGVAGFVNALKQIDGVTRVGVESSSLASKSGGEGGGGGSGGDCRTRSFIAQFQIVVAFDAAPVPLPAEGAEEVVAEAPPAEGEAATETSTAPEG